MSTTIEPHTIRSKYTDDQLRDALITATELRERIFIRGTVGADGAYGSQHWSEDQINDLHAVLNVLQALNHDDSVEGDERVNAWDILIKHPYFETCFDQDVSLLEAMLQKLDTLTQPPTASVDSADDAPAEQSWQRAHSIDDIRPGDEIKVETEGFIGIYNNPVERVGRDTQVIIFTTGDYFHWDDDFVVSRIPAPIVHPDPKEHPVILVRTYFDKDQDEVEYFSPMAMIWNGNYYESERARFLPEDITGWDPATVVPLEPVNARAESDG